MRLLKKILLLTPSTVVAPSGLFIESSVVVGYKED